MIVGVWGPCAPLTPALSFPNGRALSGVQRRQSQNRIRPESEPPRIQPVERSECSIPLCVQGRPRSCVQAGVSPLDVIGVSGVRRPATSTPLGTQGEVSGEAMCVESFRPCWALISGAASAPDDYSAPPATREWEGGAFGGHRARLSYARLPRQRMLR